VGKINELFNTLASSGEYLTGEETPVDGTHFALEALICVAGVGSLTAATFVSDFTFASIAVQWFSALGVGAACSEAVIDGFQYGGYTPPQSGGALFTTPSHSIRRRWNTGNVGKPS